MVLRGATSLWGALEGVGPENRHFFAPWNGTKEASAIWAQKRPTPVNAPRNDVAPIKTIMYRAIKTTGTLIVTVVFTPPPPKRVLLVHNEVLVHNVINYIPAPLPNHTFK